MVDWDKTEQGHYLDLAKKIKDLMDLYSIVRSKWKKSTKTSKEDWQDDLYTPFFRNSTTSPFQSVYLKQISEAMCVDGTAYKFRPIVSTWTLGLKVAREKYLQIVMHTINSLSYIILYVSYSF